MKLIRPLFFIVCLILTNSAYSGTCKLKKHLKIGPETPGIMPLWAQKRVGSDLARTFILKNYGYNFRQVSVGNIDGGFSIGHTFARGDLDEFARNTNGSFPDHGVKVTNLMAGIMNDSVSDTSYVEFVREVYLDPSKLTNYIYEALGRKVEVLNLETHTLSILKNARSNYFDGVRLKKTLKDLSDTGMITVAAAGNYYPSGSMDLTAELGSDVFIAGSADPFGLISHFSDTSKNQIIYAPSDQYLKVQGMNDFNFGGTSGAAPIVSGSIANVIAILDVVDSQTLRKILFSTATKLPAYSSGKMISQINAFKAAYLSSYLIKNNWPNTDKSILESESLDIYFKDESKKFYEKAIQEIYSRDCLYFNHVFNNLRRAFMLDQNNFKAQQALKWIYLDQGFPVEAFYIDSFGPEFDFAEDFSLRIDSFKFQPNQKAVERYYKYLSDNI